MVGRHRVPAAGSPLLLLLRPRLDPARVGEIPAQQYGGLQVADLAERSGVP
jgi:hypothetical protein